MDKKYNRDSKKHDFSEASKVFDDFYYGLLGHKLQIIGEYRSYWKGDTPRWNVYRIYGEKHKFVRAHWWRGNQK